MASTPIPIDEKFVQLAFHIERLLKEQLDENIIVVYSYTGPPNLKPKEKLDDPDELLSILKDLRMAIVKSIQENLRRTFLTKQLDAMELLIRYALEEKVTFEKRVRTGLDVAVVTISNERIEELSEQANRALQKEVLKGDLTSMATRWRKRAMTTGSEIIPLAENIAQEARRVTQHLLFKLPDTETVEFRAVPDAPWSAYNHYKGDFHAIIEINIKLPRCKYDIWKWVTHETYPGHQTQLVQRELGFQKGLLNLEGTIAIINTPDCTIAEGLAEAGTDILSSERPLSKPETISNYLMQLRRAVGINALVMLHQKQKSESEVLAYLKEYGAYEEEYAQARLPFMSDSMWGPYGFTYFIGAWLVRGFFKAAKEAHLLDEFIKALYHELHTPSTLQARIKNLDLKLPTQFI
jgi:hypothetical protein